MSELSRATRIDPDGVVDLLLELAQYFEKDPPAVLSRRSDLFVMLRRCLPEWVPREYETLKPVELCVVRCEFYNLGCHCSRQRRREMERQCELESQNQSRREMPERAAILQGTVVQPGTLPLDPEVDGGVLLAREGRSIL